MVQEKEQFARSKQSTMDVENRYSMLKLEMERIQNIRNEQESKIQILIQKVFIIIIIKNKVTEYESTINILREENKRINSRIKSQNGGDYNVIGKSLLQIPPPSIPNTFTNTRDIQVTTSTNRQVNYTTVAEKDIIFGLTGKTGGSTVNNYTAIAPPAIIL